MQATQSPAQAKKKEIYTHEAPWRIYGMNWSNRKDKPYRLALGSFIEEYNNKVATRFGGQGERRGSVHGDEGGGAAREQQREGSREAHMEGEERSSGGERRGATVLAVLAPPAGVGLQGRPPGEACRRGGSFDYASNLPKSIPP